jgi:EpsD family peptidyl-prolyl cis-trans isomerase
MIFKFRRARATCRPQVLACCTVFTIAVSAFALLGCGERKPEKVGSQTAAKVNREEVTVHQLNLLLQRQRGLTPEQTDTFSRKALEALIDQELAVQKAHELKIDQDPRVMLQLEAVKREVLARAYSERAADAPSKPSADDVKGYYDSRPELFKERKIYTLQELAVEAQPEQLNALREQMKVVKSGIELVDYLKRSKINFKGNQGVLAAEQAPMDALERLSKMKDGQMLLMPSAAGATVIMLVSSRAEPVDLPGAKPVIEQFLINDARRKRNEADVKALRAAAKIEYIGKYAEAPASGAGKALTQDSAVSPATSASGVSSADISKGMGIKK